MSIYRKQRFPKMLVMYMITALLFLTSVEVHIHDHEAAAVASHGHAVDISSLADALLPEGGNDEITVSPDSGLSLKSGNIYLLAVFLLVATLLTVLSRVFIRHARESYIQLSIIPYHGTPPLRAPPL